MKNSELAAIIRKITEQEQFERCSVLRNNGNKIWTQ